MASSVKILPGDRNEVRRAPARTGTDARVRQVQVDPVRLTVTDPVKPGIQPGADLHDRPARMLGEKVADPAHHRPRQKSRLGRRAVVGSDEGLGAGEEMVPEEGSRYSFT